MDGWMGGWMGGKAGLRIAYSNQKTVARRDVLLCKFSSALTYRDLTVCSKNIFYLSYETANFNQVRT
jgi:hypothetical protein